MLNDDDFAHVVRSAPLVSIDLVIRDPGDNVLVGLRTNEPAKGFYFVPGGRIRKDESIEDAFARIAKTETGCRLGIEEAEFIGVFEHFYRSNRYGDPNYGTHYIALAYEVRFNRRPAILLDCQHSACKWMPEAELKAAGDVHQYTKPYFGRQNRPRSRHHAGK